MSEKNLLKAYQSKLYNRIKDLAYPLETCFSIDEFIYSYISSDGDFFSISNQAAASEYYFSNNLYLYNNLIRHPDNYMDGPLFPGLVTKNLADEIIGEKFGYYVDTSLVIFIKEKKGAHKFLFNTKKNTLLIQNFYLKNLPLLNKFCEHFLEDWAPHVPLTQKYKINIGALIGPEFYKLRKNFDRANDKEIFLKKIGFLPNGFTLPKPFSNQEKSCIKLILQGKTFKEIGNSLDLSYRTVEHYFENIKNKLNCLTKSEMMEKFQQLKLLDIL